MLKVVKSEKKKEKKKSYVYMMFSHPCWNRKVRNNILNWTLRLISGKKVLINCFQTITILYDCRCWYRYLLIPFCTLVNIQFIALSHVTWLCPYDQSWMTHWFFTSNITLAPCYVFILKSIDYLNILLKHH